MIRNMVSSAFSGHHLPIAVKELTTTTHPSKTLNQQHLSLGPRNQGPVEHLPSSTYSSSQSTGAHGREGRERRRRLLKLVWSFLRFSLGAAADAPRPLTFLLPAKHNTHLRSYSDLLQRMSLSEARGEFDISSSLSPLFHRNEQ